MFEIQFISVYLFLVVARIAELIYSKTSYNWLLNQGGKEYGQKQYPYMVLLHLSWFIALPIEKEWGSDSIFTWDYLTVMACMALTLGMIIRLYSISILGKYWCTKVVVIPNQPIINSGLYKYLRHPNYYGAWLEVLFVPLIFKLYLTAILFATLKIPLLYSRIKTENKALNIK